MNKVGPSLAQIYPSDNNPQQSSQSHQIFPRTRDKWRGYASEGEHVEGPQGAQGGTETHSCRPMCPNRPVVWKCSILGEGAHCYRKRPTLVEATTHVAARSYPHIIQNTSMIPYARTMCTVGSMSPRLHTGAKILAAQLLTVLDCCSNMTVAGSHTAQITSVAARSYPHIIPNTSRITVADKCLMKQLPPERR